MLRSHGLASTIKDAIDVLSSNDKDKASVVNAPVEYYNIQGVRIANPEQGQIVIVKKGAKASKVIF